MIFQEIPLIPGGASRVVCFSSGKGGVGKTSVAINLGLALVEKGRKVLLVDGDLGLANVDVMLGLTVRTTIRDVLERGDDPMQAVVFPEPDFGVLPASSGVPEMVNLGPEDHDQLAGVFGSIAKAFEYVLIDTAAGIGPSVLWLNSLADYNTVVLNPDPAALTDAYALIKVLHREYRREIFHLLVNLVRDEREGIQVCEGLAKVVRKFLGISLEYLGSVPRDPEVIRAVREQVPFVRQRPGCRAAGAVRKLADSLEAWACLPGGKGESGQNYA